MHQRDELCVVSENKTPGREGRGSSLQISGCYQ
jgi:hypothetical protein